MDPHPGCGSAAPARSIPIRRLAYRSLVPAFCLCFLAPCLASSSGSHDANPADLDTVIAQAQQKRLAEERLWHLLLHYRPRPLGGFKSEADGEGFFFHPHGKVDPRGELEATLRAFFSPTPEAGPQDERWQHPQCRFPARYQWLKAQLHFDPSKLPTQPCPRFEAWRRALDPGSVTLIFATHYLSNPASMFGHTLLRLNHRQRREAQSLLDYGINYAAITTTRNGLLYAILGMTGGFEGRFANFPYYMKVQEYSNLESRDLWEYDLTLTQEQVDRLLRHLWELGNTYFRYYFFQENCSYHILSLLEVANPALHLTDQFLFAVVPSETVRRITEPEDLVSRVVYRPSILSQLNQKRRVMDKAALQVLRHILKSQSLRGIEAADLDVSQKALVLDAAIDVMQYRKLKNLETLPPAEKAFAQRLLISRSQLGIPTPPVPQEAPASRPELGHGTSRLRLAFGGAEGLGGFLEVSYPSFHDLLDPEDGFPRYSQLQLLTPTIRYYIDARRIDLERFDAVRIVSLSPLDAFVKKPSWQLNVGYETVHDLDCRLCHWYKAEVGSGVALHIAPAEAALAYGLVNVEAGIGEAFDPDVRLSPGASVGLLLQPSPRWRLHMSGSLYYPVVGGGKPYYRHQLHQHVAFTRNLGLRLELNQFRASLEGLVALHIYF